MTEAHAEIERQVPDRLPRILDEPLPDRGLRLLLGLQVGLLILVVVAEQRVGERVVRVQRVDVDRGLGAEVEAPLEAGALRPLAGRVELVEEAGLEQVAALRPRQRVDDRITAVARGDRIARVVGDGRARRDARVADRRHDAEHVGARKQLERWDSDLTHQVAVVLAVGRGLAHDAERGGRFVHEVDAERAAVGRLQALLALRVALAVEVPVPTGAERAAVADRERIPVAPPHRQPILRRRVEVDLQLVEALRHVADVLIPVVVLAEADAPVGEVRIGKLVQERAADRIEPVGRDDVAGKAGRSAGGRAAGARAQRIADEDQAAVGIERLREVPLALERSGHGRRARPLRFLVLPHLVAYRRRTSFRAGRSGLRGCIPARRASRSGCCTGSTAWAGC